MQYDDPDYPYEAATHLDIDPGDSFYPDWDGQLEELELPEPANLLDADDPRSEEQIIFDALTEAGLV